MMTTGIRAIIPNQNDITILIEGSMTTSAIRQLTLGEFVHTA